MTSARPGRNGRNGWILGLALTLIVGATPDARADGAAALPIGGGTREGCPGEIVVFELLAFYDNCACLIPAPPANGCAVDFVSVASNGPGNFPAVFGPGITTGDSIPCTPDPNPGCPAHPDTGIVQNTFFVSVVIPAGAPVGSTDSHTVTIRVCNTPTTVKLTTNVVACPGGGGPGFPGAAGPGAGANLGNPGGGGGVNLFNNGLRAVGGEAAEVDGAGSQAAAPNRWSLVGGSMPGAFGEPTLQLVPEGPGGPLHAVVDGLLPEQKAVVVVSWAPDGEAAASADVPLRAHVEAFRADAMGRSQLVLSMPGDVEGGRLLIQAFQLDPAAADGVARSAAWSSTPAR